MCKTNTIEVDTSFRNENSEELMLKNINNKYLTIFWNFGRAEILGLVFLLGVSLNEADISFQSISFPVKQQILTENHFQKCTFREVMATLLFFHIP